MDVTSQAQVDEALAGTPELDRRAACEAISARIAQTPSLSGADIF